jgi:hypothetical protein
MFGESSLARFTGMAHDYESWPSAPNPIVLGVEAGGHLVGVALATLPGQCGLCDEFIAPPSGPPSEAARVDYEFHVACRNSHLSNNLAPHARIQTVATEPTLHGSGIGRTLMTALVDGLRAKQVDSVVLECLTSREAFYEHFGFRRLDEFDDPGGPGLRAVLMKADLVGH